MSHAPIPSTPTGIGASPAWPAPRPRHFPPPRLRRIDVLWRYLLAGSSVVGSLGLAAVFSVTSHESWQRATLRLAGMTLVGVMSLWLMRYRRRWPLAIACLSSVLTAVGNLALLTPEWALVSLATRRRFKEVAPAVLVLIGAREFALVNPLGRESTPTASPMVLHLTTLVGSSLEAALLVATGFYIGARRDLVASLREQVQTTEREQELAVLHAEAQERNRIAREMHDVVAHRISLVAMHAGALAYRDDLSAEETREIAQTIQDNAAASLTELRSVLGQLRGTASPVRLPDKPQPTLADIRGLVLDARAAGMVVDFDEQVERLDLLPAQTGRHAYRIVQEALTNARKHAAGARVHVQVGGGPGRGLDLLVQNPLRGGTAGLPGARAGLVGMHERAQMVGGVATAGVHDGFFEVKVWLPW